MKIKRLILLICLLVLGACGVEEGTNKVEEAKILNDYIGEEDGKELLDYLLCEDTYNKEFQMEIREKILTEKNMIRTE